MSCRTALCSVLLGIGLHTTVFGDIINVPGDQPTIQAGINAAVNGDEVVVAVGTYNESINFLGKAVTLRSSGGPAVTTIDARGAGSVVTCAAGEGANTVLEGFTITGGTGAISFFGYMSGGGMFIQQSSPTVTNCTFTGNMPGGGMYVWGSPTVTNCTFSGNISGDASFNGVGGGMNLSVGDARVTDCTFSDNAAFYGGGMSIANGSPTVTHCTFSGNTANSGGGMSNVGSSPTVTNCSFTGNAAANLGGGMRNSSSSPTVTNTGFCNNTPDQINGTYSDGGGNSLLYCPPPIPKANPCPTDTNDDGVTNVLDLIDVLLAFGTACP